MFAFVVIYLVLQY